MSEKIKIKYSGKSIELKVHRAENFFKYLGLMFKTKNTPILLFDFKKEVDTIFHSFFVFFKFFIIWLDSEDNVIDCRSINPFNFFIKSKKRFRKVIEIPFNEKNKGIINMFRKYS